MNANGDDADEWIEDPKVMEMLQDTLDETDYRIMKSLNQDGRMSDTELADLVGVSRTSARRRRKKLQSDNVLDIRAVIVLQESGFSHVDTHIKYSVDASQEDIEELIHQLLDEPFVFEMAECMGEHDLLVRVWYDSLVGAKSYIRQQIHSHPVVSSYTLSPVVKSYKLWFQDYS